MKKFTAQLAVAAFALATCFAFAADTAESAKPMCPVSGKAAAKEHAVAYKGGEVYFCCPNCPKAFEANPEKFAVKANHQLVVTDQAKQVACPFTGGKLNTEKKTDVAGVTVAFCCGNCLAKAEKAEDEALVAAVFADAPFEKAYKVGDKKDE